MDKINKYSSMLQIETWIYGPQINYKLQIITIVLFVPEQAIGF